MTDKEMIGQKENRIKRMGKRKWKKNESIGNESIWMTVCVSACERNSVCECACVSARVSACERNSKCECVCVCVWEIKREK